MSQFPAGGFPGPAECNGSWEEKPGQGLRKRGAWERDGLTLAGSRWEGGTQLVSLLSQAHPGCIMRSKHLDDSSNGPALGPLGGQGGDVEDGLRHVTGANWDT